MSLQHRGLAEARRIVVEFIQELRREGENTSAFEAAVLPMLRPDFGAGLLGAEVIDGMQQEVLAAFSPAFGHINHRTVVCWQALAVEKAIAVAQDALPLCQAALSDPGFERNNGTPIAAIARDGVDAIAAISAHPSWATIYVRGKGQHLSAVLDALAFIPSTRLTRKQLDQAERLARL